jgi:lipopolysaccharide cholinephosphotransferase
MENKLNLEEEIIDGYKVSSQMKRIWQVELDLLEKLIEVCNKYNLTYFFIGGSLIGAVRHNGFIPWDDDIDVGMFREDYNKLLEIADREFNEPFFFQTPYSDNIYRGHAQIRMNNTSAILPTEIHLNHHQGIFIDVFPFDEYPNSDKEFNKQKKKLHTLETLLKYPFRRKYDTLKSKSISLFVNKLDRTKLYKKYENEASKFNNNGNGLVSNLSFKYGREKYAHNKEYFQNLTTHKFHYLDVNIPIDYDKILTKQYGNYMDYVIAPSTHGSLYQSADIDYKEYLIQLRKDLKNEKI